MDRFPGSFDEGSEWTELEIDSRKLERILSTILKEFNLTLKDIDRRPEKGDYILSAENPMGTESRCLVRVRAYTIGLDKEDAEDLYEDMIDLKATSAIFLTDSHFTKDAREYEKDVPIRLVDGSELNLLLTEHAVPKAEFAFLSAFSDKEVVRYFSRFKAKKFLGIIGKNERIEEIDKRYMPVGHFEIKKVTRDSETTKNIYVDLTSGNIFHMEENRIEENDFFKKILDLPEESQTHLLDLIKYGELKHEHMNGKPLNILEKERLIEINDKGRATSTLDILLNEFTETVSVATSEVTTLTHPEPKDMKYTSEGKKYVKEILNKPAIDSSYDLGHFIQARRETDPDFEPDPIHYDPERVAYILDSIYKEEDVSFTEMAYLPYYRGKYVSEYGAVRFKKLFTPRFEKFVPKKTAFNLVYRIIDVVPAVPYLVIGLIYLLLNLDDLDATLHIFSTAFLFVTAAVVLGVLVKVIFKTERRMPRYGNTIVKYGFPSLHALTSAGAVAFIYFVDPALTLILLPLALVYIWSRLRLGVHSETDILGGAVIGIAVGVFFGEVVLNSFYPGETFETIMSAMFFIIPLVVTLFESQYR